MIEFEPNQILEELDKGIEKDGDLTLIIACTKCDAQFELNKGSVLMAIGTKATFIEYLRWVQSSKCPNCHKEKNDNF